MVLDDVFGPSAEIGERVTVSRQRYRHIGNVGHSPQRLEEQGERVAVRRQTADVRCDRWQHMVAGEHHAELGVVQAQVVEGVARGVDRDPLATGELDGLAVDETHGRPGRGECTSFGAATADPFEELG